MRVALSESQFLMGEVRYKFDHVTTRSGSLERSVVHRVVDYGLINEFIKEDSPFCLQGYLAHRNRRRPPGTAIGV